MITCCGDRSLKQNQRLDDLTIRPLAPFANAASAPGLDDQQQCARATRHSGVESYLVTRFWVAHVPGAPPDCQVEEI
jgi:hypothetical protein